MAVAKHTDMMTRMMGDSLYSDAMKKMIGENTNLKNDLIARTLGGEIFDRYVDKAYDSSADYWKVVTDENGNVIDVKDDGDYMHINIYDEFGKEKGSVDKKSKWEGGSLALQIKNATGTENSVTQINNLIRATLGPDFADGDMWLSYDPEEPVIIEYGPFKKSALKKIVNNKDEINNAAEVFGVDPNGIASVIFQEKYHGIFAEIKDSGSIVWDYLFNDCDLEVNDKTPLTRSFGLAEMQLGLASEICGFDKNVAGTRKKAYDYLMNDSISISLIAANIKKNEKELGYRLESSAAGYAHNMGSKRYRDYLNGDKSVRDSVAKRSTFYQESIKDALKGSLNSTPDYKRKK